MREIPTAMPQAPQARLDLRNRLQYLADRPDGGAIEGWPPERRAALDEMVRADALAYLRRQAAAAVEERLEEGRVRVDRRGWTALRDGHLNDAQALTAVRRWLRADRPFLVLLGGPGSGKSVAASWWITALDLGSRGDAALERWGQRYVDLDTLNFSMGIKAYPLGRYELLGNLVRLQQARFGEEAARYRELLDTPRLVIDELGAEHCDPADARACLFDVIDARQRPRRATVLVGNLTTQAFVERYAAGDARTLDRLRSDNAVFFEIDDDSMRGGDLP